MLLSILQIDTYRITIILHFLQSLAGCFQVAVIRENNERIMFSKDSNYEKEKPIKLKEQVHNKTMLNVTC